MVGQFQKTGSSQKNRQSYSGKNDLCTSFIECIKSNGLDFIFKGGTSLVLLLESATKGKYPGTILLDVLIEDSIYPEVTEKPVQAKWIISVS